MTSGVPNLSLDDLIVDANAAGGELDADGGLGLAAELILGEPGEEIGFADAGVADEHNLEQIIVIVIRSVGPHFPCTTRSLPFLPHFTLLLRHSALTNFPSFPTFSRPFT